MSRKNLSIFFLMILFLGICIVLLYIVISKIRPGGSGMSSEIAVASKEFKEQMGHREDQAKILLPYLKVGMRKEDIISLLGEPDYKNEYEYYELISYIIGRSNLISVFLDENAQVIHVESVWSEYSNPLDRI